LHPSRAPFIFEFNTWPMNPFIDPIALLRISLPVEGMPDAADLRRAKHRLLAEFELGDGVTIPHAGKDIDRATALRAVESLEDPKVLADWVALHRHAQLKTFLASPAVRHIQRLPPATSFATPQLRAFAGTYFTHVFGQLMVEAVLARNWVDVARILWRIDLVPFEDVEITVQAFVRHVRVVMQKLEDMKAYSRDQVLADWDAALVTAPLIAAFNALPVGYKPLRRQMGVLIYLLCKELASRLGVFSQARQLNALAIPLDVGSDCAQALRAQQIALSRGSNAQNITKEKAESSRTFWILIGLAHLAFLLVRLRGCGG
jgi:hypothetical protein